MAGIDNSVLNGIGIRLEDSTSQSISIMQDDANGLSIINYTATPEGAVSANPGSLCMDRTNGTLYLKVTGTGNTGWSQITPGGVGNVWENINASQTLEVNHGYFCTANALSLALPSSSEVGDTIKVVLRGGTSWTITQGAGQQIRIGSSSTTSGAGGSLASQADGDSVNLVCQTANLIWVQEGGPQGNITIV